jgi:CRP-like cAMP-binding protein
MFVTSDQDFLTHAQELALPSRKGTGGRLPALRLRQGQFLYHQGDDARTVFRVVDGVLRLSRVTEAGQQQVVGFGYPGDIVGFHVQGQRTTDCDALTPATLAVIAATLPDEETGQAADAAFLAAAALWEIGAMQDHLMTLGRKSSRERVASFLVVLLRRAGRWQDGGLALDLPMSRADIADFLGIRTETVSRAFTDLRQSGVIALPSAQHVVVLDPAALGGIAEGD